MKTVDNLNATASPRGGVESSMMGIRSTATKVNTIRRERWTSLLENGEVVSSEQSRRGDMHGRHRHGSPCVSSCVVGGSRSKRGCVSEDERTVRKGGRKRPLTEVRAVIVAKRGTTTKRSRVMIGGAKDGRKVERQNL